MEIVIFILGSIGLTHILVDSKIMQPVRDWFQKPYWAPLSEIIAAMWGFVKKLFAHPIVWAEDYIITTIGQIMGCYQCQGFWAGLLGGWFAFTNANLCQILMAGFSGSFLANCAAIYLNYLEASTIVNLHEEKHG